MPIVSPEIALLLSRTYESSVIVKEASQLSGTLDSNKVYYIDGQVDLSNTSIEVPATGLTIYGLGFNISSLTSSENNFSLFTSPVGGSGDLFIRNLSITVSGTSSKVFDLTDSTGTHALEMSIVNFNGCTSLGELIDYRQVLEQNTGRFGGSPEITLSGSMNGYRATTSIVRGVTLPTALFKEGTGLTFSGRFISDMNCDLPATGAFFNFQPSNFINNESFILSGCFITRQGTIDAKDTTIYPNLNGVSIKSFWDGNVGIPNTQKYIKSSLTAEVTTVVAAPDTYYPLLGTFVVDEASHFSMPANGEFQLESGNGTYHFTGDIPLAGTANDEISIRVTLSTDGGSTYPTEINHIRRTINNFSGGRDVAFFPLDFIYTINAGERVRLEVENYSGGRNVTAELDSFFVISAV